MDTEIIIVIVILCLLAWLWRMLNRHLFKKANLVKEITFHTGPKLKSSGWYGRAHINGVYFKRAVKVIQCEQGYVLKVIFVFGGGMLWIPKKGMEIIEKPGDGFFGFSDCVSINSGENKVRLYGHLAEYIDYDDANANPDKVS